MSETTSTIRLYVETPLSDNHLFELTPRQSHYILNVMRSEIGRTVLVFNGKDGEYFAKLEQVQKRTAIFRTTHQTRHQVEDTPLDLYFAPIKGERLGFLIEKATELGVTNFYPIFTQHTVPSHINLDRLDFRIIEAAEQCERLTLPTLHDPCPLEEMLESRSDKTPIYFCEERSESPTLLEAFNQTPLGHAFLIGPEGGFSSEEKNLLNASPHILSVHLGNRILRSETAVFMALSLFNGYQETLQKKTRSKAA